LVLVVVLVLLVLVMFVSGGSGTHCPGSVRGRGGGGGAGGAGGRVTIGWGGRFQTSGRAKRTGPKGVIPSSEPPIVFWTKKKNKKTNILGRWVVHGWEDCNLSVRVPVCTKVVATHRT
jgi:hypothetical protein